jgi:hypothetical protein
MQTLSSGEGRDPVPGRWGQYQNGQFPQLLAVIQPSTPVKGLTVGTAREGQLLIHLDHFFVPWSRHAGLGLCSPPCLWLANGFAIG